MYPVSIFPNLSGQIEQRLGVAQQNRKMSSFIHDTACIVESFQYPQDDSLLGGLDLAEEKGCFSYANLTEKDGHLFLDNLNEAIARRCTAVAAGLIIRGLPVSQQNLDRAIENDLEDVVLAIVQRTVPLDATSIIFCINYACQKEDDELIQTILERKDVTSDHIGYALQQLCLNSKQEEANYLLIQINNSCHRATFRPFSPPPLHRACLAGDWKRVRELVVGLSQKDLQAVWPLTGQTAVQLAAALGHDVLVNELIAAQADRMLKVGTQEFGVNRALLSSRSEAFRALFEKFKEKDQKTIELYDTPIHEFRQFLEFLSTDRLEVTSENFATIALLADRYAITGVIELLLNWLDEHPEDKHYIFNTEQDQADQDQAEIDLSELKEQLQGLVQGLERLPKVVRPAPLQMAFPDQEEMSPPITTEAELLEKLATNRPVSYEELSHACKYDWIAAVSFAMQNNYAKRYDLAPDLCQAMPIIPSAIARLLVGGGVNFVDYRSDGESNTTLLHHAVREGNRELVRLMLEKVPPEKKQDFINATCREEEEDCFRAIDIACLNHDDAMVQLLRAHGARPLETSLNKILWDGGYEALRLYFDCFSEDDRKEIVNRQDPSGRTALHILIMRLQPDGNLHNMEMDFTELKLFIESGADLSIKDQDGLNPFEYALQLADTREYGHYIPGMILMALPKETRQEICALIGRKPSKGA